MFKVIFLVFFFTCSLGAISASAQEFRLGEKGYKIDKVYAPIYGSLTGNSFAVHYCLPKFEPVGEGVCGLGTPERNKKVVQVIYENFVGMGDKVIAPLETASLFKFPFSESIKISGYTPYIDKYMTKAESLRTDNSSFLPVLNDEKKIKGLILYESSSSSAVWVWVPEINKYKTRIGNPIAFICFPSECRFVLDVQNGWIVSARFSESALNEWERLYLDINKSTGSIIGE